MIQRMGENRSDHLASKVDIRSASKFFLKVMPVILLSAYGSFSAQASTVTAATQMTVQAAVVAACQINSVESLSMTGLTFSSTGTSSGNLSVTCTNGTSYSILLDAGSGTSATTAARVLTAATSGNTNTLTYGLYRDSSYTEAWGNTVGTDTLDETGSGVAQSWPVYAKILAGLTTAPVDSYTDTVNVTVSY